MTTILKHNTRKLNQSDMTDVWPALFLIFDFIPALLIIGLLRCCCNSNRMSQNEDDQSVHFEDPPTRGAIHNAVPEVRLDINDEFDVVDEKLHNFVLPENVKEHIYERSKCKNENDHDCVICLEVYKEKETIALCVEITSVR
uniref:Uncharacterized protein n=1 Tax=Tanacetum cinerariifolium TaxID=118510 RepID=A0A699QBR5_TANCI|nr:hypothetical protein [Tanacetum cinerariifolium]